jgi:hypothetical protein
MYSSEINWQCRYKRHMRSKDAHERYISSFQTAIVRRTNFEITSLVLITYPIGQVCSLCKNSALHSFLTTPSSVLIDCNVTGLPGLFALAGTLSCNLSYHESYQPATSCTYRCSPQSSRICYLMLFEIAFKQGFDRYDDLIVGAPVAPGDSTSQLSAPSR